MKIRKKTKNKKQKKKLTDGFLGNRRKHLQKNRNFGEKKTQSESRLSGISVSVKNSVSTLYPTKHGDFIELDCKKNENL